MIINSKVDFYPVGQGLFSYGEICLAQDENRVFSWVFDCGTSSSQSLVDSAISDIRRRKKSRLPSINLVCISHFDKDHVSGLVRLLESFHVEMLLLPLIPLWRRVAILVSLSSKPSKLVQDFLMDPTAFVRARSPNGVGRIVYFQEGAAAGGAEAERAGPAIDGIAVLAVQAGGRESSVIQPLSSDTADVTLAVGGAIQVESHWEFVPYSDPAPALNVDQDFITKVEGAAKELMLAKGLGERRDCLARVSHLYDLRFGAKNYLLRNLMSTFLYSGPLDPQAPSYLSSTRFCGGTAALEGREFPVVQLLLLTPLQHGDGSAHLFTGDASLDTASRLSSLCAHFGANRVDGIRCLQVMHHGALPNWNQDVPAALGPVVSVFSSDPSRKGSRHPHPIVWRSFIRHGREQVDKEVGIRFEAVSYVA